MLSQILGCNPKADFHSVCCADSVCQGLIEDMLLDVAHLVGGFALSLKVQQVGDVKSLWTKLHSLAKLDLKLSMIIGLCLGELANLLRDVVSLSLLIVARAHHPWALHLECRSTRHSIGRSVKLEVSWF